METEPACRLTGGRALPESEHAVSPRLCKQPRVNMQSTVPGRTAAGRWDVCLSARRAQSALLPLRLSPSTGSKSEVRVPQVQVQKHTGWLNVQCLKFFKEVRLDRVLFRERRQAGLYKKNGSPRLQLTGSEAVEE